MVRALNTPIQLALNIGLGDDVSFANFYLGDNANIVHALSSLDSNASSQLIYLWGNFGIGRSHLAKATCKHLNGLNLPSLYVSLKEHQSFTPAILENLEKMFLVCLDDLDVVLGKREWEEAIMYLFNRIADAKRNLLITANVAPVALNCFLSDLKSRLASCLILQLQGLSDEQKFSALELRSKERGLIMPSEVARFLLRHYERNMDQLFAILDRLELATLRTKRPLTIPFVKSVLEGEFS
ncbi:MAG: DnaA regulatory inactivator Hda [Gammaproteobacteria bacterium]